MLDTFVSSIFFVIWYDNDLEGEYMREFVINENDAFQRVDKYIQKTCHQMPKSLMFRLIRQKKIKVNRKRCEPNQMLKVNYTVQMFISEEFFVEKTVNIQHTKKLNNIVFEDENFFNYVKSKLKNCLKNSDELKIIAYKEENSYKNLTILTSNLGAWALALYKLD